MKSILNLFIPYLAKWIKSQFRNKAAPTTSLLPIKNRRSLQRKLSTPQKEFKPKYF